MTKILSIREKLILIITIAVVIFVISFNFIFEPVISKNSSLNREIRIEEARLSRYHRLLSQKELIEKKYRNKFSSIFKPQTQEDSLVSALSNLEDLAKQAKIRIIDIRPQGASTESDSYRELMIDMRAEGKIEGFLKFIYSIENSLSLLKVKKFQLTAKPNSDILEGRFSISQISLD